MHRGRGRGGDVMDYDVPSYPSSVSMGYGDYYSIGCISAGPYAAYDMDLYSYGGYPSVYAHAYGGAAPRGAGVIGTHTKARDEHSMRSRIFVGNLNPKLVTREQLESIYTRFGAVTALSLHKGFAFIQYGTEHEARSAVSFTDGMQLGGQHIESEDVMKCGRCGFKTGDMGDFKLHKLSGPCDPTRRGKKEGSVEPSDLQCFICNSPFDSAWRLLQHVTQVHDMHCYADK